MHRKLCKSKLVFSICIIFCIFFTGCSSIQHDTGIGNKTLSYKDSEKELTDTLKDENLTAVQKIIIKHAISDLKQAQATDKKVGELEKKVISSAEKAGAGKLIYTIIYFVAFLIVAFIGFKIMRKFSFF